MHARRLARLAESLARVSARVVPDAFSIACLLTLFAFALALGPGGASPDQALRAWGGGFWALLEFSMQMVMVIFAGYVAAVSPPMTRLLDGLAGVPRGPRAAVGWTALVSMLACWLNWGLGLIAAAVLVRFVARRHPNADYRLLVAAAYLGLGATWHAGPSGSVPLLMATPGSFMIRDGLIPAPIPLAQTVFTTGNLVLMAIVSFGLSVVAMLLHPEPGHVVRADARLLEGLAAFEAPARPESPTLAQRIGHGPLLTRLVGGLGLGYTALTFASGELELTLNSVNLLFLSLAIFLHPSPASLQHAAEDASRSVYGVVLQFPLYAGIYGLMQGTGLAGWLADVLLHLATATTYPLVVFWYSAILNYFVPSGGGKWAIEALYVLEAGRALGLAPARVAMAYAYGDMATNLIQPFWAIPLLGVARLEFRDVLGFLGLLFALYAGLMSLVLLLG